jgi:Domain of unknown function (DUF4296)
MGTRGIGVPCPTGIPGHRLGHRVIAGCLAIVLLAGIGCADKESVPSGILPPGKMQTVMWDMIQADQYAALSVAKDSSGHINTKVETLKLYEEVFRLHEVSREEFRKSYQYYLDHPELNQRLFDSLVSQGTRLRTESYSRPIPNRVPPIIPPHLPGTTLPTSGGTLSPVKAPMPGGMQGRPRIFPPHQPVTMPGLRPAVFPAKAQKDSARKHL